MTRGYTVFMALRSYSGGIVQSKYMIAAWHYQSPTPEW